MQEVNEIRFTIFGNPVGKARARVVRLKNGKPHSFTPESTAAWEESIAGQALAHRPPTPLEGPLSLEVTFYRQPTKEAERKAKHGDIIFPETKPDMTNYLKSLEDALNGIMWRDDAQIVDVVARKRYGTPARVEVVLRGELEVGA